MARRSAAATSASSIYAQASSLKQNDPTGKVGMARDSARESSVGRYRNSGALQSEGQYMQS